MRGVDDGVRGGEEAGEGWGGGGGVGEELLGGRSVGLGLFGWAGGFVKGWMGALWWEQELDRRRGGG